MCKISRWIKLLFSLLPVRCNCLGSSPCWCRISPHPVPECLSVSVATHLVSHHNRVFRFFFGPSFCLPQLLNRRGWFRSAVRKWISAPPFIAKTILWPRPPPPPQIHPFWQLTVFDIFGRLEEEDEWRTLSQSRSIRFLWFSVNFVVFVPKEFCSFLVDVDFL